ncbi:UDP-3-O-acylglucosamine N-acyltransferase [Bacilli bacterium]|nr:UDP-3-O-acylglucosamine N-acyltransferase [Bacilli bacterium]
MQNILELERNLKKFGKFGDFFHKKNEYITVAEINSLVTVRNFATLVADDKIYGLSTLTSATANEATFLSNVKYVRYLKNTKAGYCIIDEKYEHHIPEGVKPIVVADVHYAFAIILDYFYFVPQFLVSPGVDAGAWVDSTANIGIDSEIQHGAVIGKNVTIGKGCKICANAVIGHDCQIGDGTYIGSNSTISYAKIGKNVVIQNGVNIGQCGFGFAHEKGFNHKIPQIGIVIVGDNVEIGSASCIDRGALEDTVIGDNTKIDNLVQIAHGVKIGVGCFIAAQVGIAGSTKIGNYVQIGGKAGIIGHIEIGDQVQIAAHSGIAKSVENGTAVAGCPAMPIAEWRKSVMIIKRLATRGD